MATPINFNALRAQAMGSSQEEEAVTVNTRALIDKVLARYSGEWTVLRELLQNAADATASKVVIKFETLPSLTVPVPQNSESSTILSHTLLHHTLKRLIVSNDGNQFGPNDWARLKRIAEGNPDETKIGAFGVGFYSVFADCEEPFVRSGNEAMAFYWKKDSLFTRRLKLSEQQTSLETNFVLDYRSSTSPIPKILPLCQFLASSITFVGLTQVELWIDDFRLLTLTKLTAPGAEVKIPRALVTRTHEGLFRVESVVRETAQLEAKWLNIVAWKPKAASISICGGGQSAVVGGAPSTQSLRSFFSRFSQNSNNAAVEKVAREEQEAQEAIAEDLVGESKATVFLHVNTAIISANINAAFSVELERATKKPPPKTTKIAVLTSSFDEKAASTTTVTGTASKATDIFVSVLPSKSGRIFIGFPTHQTTGLSAHISAQSVIPTVERESIDLNARYVRTWNSEMLRAAGIVCRIAWSGEITSLKQKLSTSLKGSGRTKVNADDVAKVVPEAIHMLNQFTFRESTPSSQVATLVEEAFWTCSHTATIEILSSCGIMPSQDVRMATEDLTFVSGIPVLPPEVIKQASGFVKKLMDYGIITDITTGDIKKELERQALTEKQLVEFLRWIGHKAKINEVDQVIVRSLLDVTVANEDNGDINQERLIVLGGIKNFINPSRIPGNVPVPPDTTLSFKLTKNLDKVELEALGWEDLQIVPWLRWLVESAGGRAGVSKEQDLTMSPTFAAVILPILSKQWDGLSQSSKTTVIELLRTRTVIPTRLGMRLPTEAYFPTVKIFDDLPVITGLQSVKEKFLAALGVRKTIELGLVFERLLAPPKYSADASLARPAWSHTDLIKYLASVRSDIPLADVQRLRNTAICPSEMGNGRPSEQRYCVSELLEPNETLRSLGLPLLYWPSLLRPGSEEVKFLSFLGLKPFPTVAELILLIASAKSNGDLALSDRALKYFANFHFQNTYSIDETKATKIPFLPIEGDPKASVLPTQCYTNENATLMGFQVLRKDLHPHAARLGVDVNPPILDCVNRLTQNPPEDKRIAMQVFGYMSTRLNELNSRLSEMLSQISFVPVLGKTSSVQASIKHLPPRLCFLGTGQDEQYREVFDYVDFGSTANSFLLRCGSKHEPSPLELARVVVREPARVFTVFESPDRYLELLRTLAGSWSNLKKDKALVKDMKNASFLLGFKDVMSQGKTAPNMNGNTADTYAEDDNIGVRTYELATADQVVVIVDDVINYNLFRGNFLAAPMEEELEDFYIALGATTLSYMVEQKLLLGQPNDDQRDAAKLEKLISERIKLFLHEIPSDHVRYNATWIEKNLCIIVVKSLAIKKSLKLPNISLTQATTAFQGKNIKLSSRTFPGHTLFVTPGIHDLYDVGQALSHLLLTRPKAQHAITLTVLLDTDLYKLRARGYNVERILQKKAAENKVAEEQRKRQLEEEQKTINEQAANNISQLQIRNSTSQQPEHPIMPGLFPDSPDRLSRGARPQSSENDSMIDQRRGGFFGVITRALGGEDGGNRRSQLANTGGGAQPPPPYSQDDPDGTIETHTPPQPGTAPHQLQQNLINAIKSSRSYNSSSVVSNPATNYVRETQTFCDAKPAQNISFIAQTSMGINIYLSNTMADKNKFMEERSSALESFAAILIDCADTIALARKSLHIFHDHQSNTIAFNHNKALFFNYRYFEDLHFANVRKGKKSEAIIYWFVVLCHELAHNLVADHSSAHSYYTESFLIQYFTKIAVKIGSTLQDGEWSRDANNTSLLD